MPILPTGEGQDDRGTKQPFDAGQLGSRDDGEFTLNREGLLVSNQIPGVPEGWELVHAMRHAIAGEHYIGSDGVVRKCLSERESMYTYPIIRKIEKPATYRPFKDAEEFKPHRDRWLTRKDRSDPAPFDGACRVVAYCDNHLWWADGRVSTYREEFDHGRCFDDNGTPFGVKIDGE